MSEKQVLIIEHNGKIEIETEDFNDFELIGLLECFLFSLKNQQQMRQTAGESSAYSKSLNQDPAADDRTYKNVTVKSSGVAKNSKPLPQDNIQSGIKIQPAEINSDSSAGTAQTLKTRITNAIKAINALGGDMEFTDLSKLTEEELQAELSELTDQYKRLKNSQKVG